MMASVVKRIKPSRLKEDFLRLKILSIMHKMEREMKKDFQATTETWEYQPEWLSMVGTSPNGPEVMVWTDDKIYGYVNNGTESHVIVGNPLLAFSWDGYGSYGPKTTPGIIGSVDAVLPTTPVVFSAVLHPGIEARNFDKAISEKWTPKFKDMCEQAMRDAVKESGHEMK
jgi:hypothetical protein